jgi:type I restriction enzyme S subunit
MSKNDKAPELRFKGYTDNWKQRKLSEILQERQNKTSDFKVNPLYSLTIEDGVTPKTERYERSFLVQKEDSIFKIVCPNEFVTNPMNFRFGSFGYNKNRFNVSVSGYYDVFSIDNDQCSSFWYSYFKTPTSLRKFDKVATGSLIEKRRVKFSTLKEMEFLEPLTMEEKQKIADYLEKLDNLITLHQCKLEKLQNMKKSCLQKMFPQNNEQVPEIRFEGFSSEWRKRTLGSCFDERVESMPDGELLSVTIGSGIKKFSDLDRHDNSNNDKSKYKKVCVGDIAYNSMRMWQGASGYSPYVGIVSPAYTVVKPNEGIDSQFFAYMFKKKDMTHLFEINSQGLTSDTWNLKYPAFSKIVVRVPDDIKEQKKIAEFLQNLDKMIMYAEQELELTKRIKKGCLQKMFV